MVKSYAVMGGLHGAVDAARKIRESVVAENISKIDITVGETVYKHGWWQPERPLTAIGARPVKGVLFTGPPGTGKTMLARIIASAADAVFYEISGPEIFSKWYGESEKILRLIFGQAAKQPRSIIFFDEIDSVAGQRSGDAHEASKRVVAQLLTLMDGFDVKDNVVVIAATTARQTIQLHRIALTKTVIIPAEPSAS